MRAGSPFRDLPWPLGQIRTWLRWLRLVRIKVGSRSPITCGTSVALGRNADIRAPNGVVIGSFVSIGKDFTCESDLRIGSHVLISSCVSVIGKDHRFDDPNCTIYDGERLENSSVVIGDDVLIGFGTILIGPVTVGQGCIVGAGSIVTRDLPPYSVCAGNPARVIKSRFPADGAHLSSALEVSHG